MKIKDHVIIKIRHSTSLRRELAYNLKISEVTLARHLSRNEDNGDLTKLLAIQIISRFLEIAEADIIDY